MKKQKVRSPEVVKTFVMKDMDIVTNVGLQTLDLHCSLVKHHWGDRVTLAEKLFFGYKNYGYRLDIKPSRPIRENRDKDYLDGFSEEGNDATYETSLGLGIISNSNPENTTDEYLKIMVYNWAKEFSPMKKSQRVREKKKSWRSRMLFKKNSKDYDKSFQIWTNIYPFHGSDLSGHTDIISFELATNDEDGVQFHFCLFGITFYLSSFPLYKWLHKKIVKNRPTWNRNEMDWKAFDKVRTQWEKEYPREAFFDNDFRIEVGVNRAYGFFYRKEKGFSSYGTKSFNPWRNKFWKLI